MTVSYRQMRPNDVRDCVDIIAAHPVVGPRYGNAIEGLGPAWLKLLSSDGFCISLVFEEANEAKVNKLGVIASVFVSDEFLREAKTPPHFWFGPELAKRVVRGDSPVLSSRQVCEANTGDGLNLMEWQMTFRDDAVLRADVRVAGIAAVAEYLRGYRFKEVVAQVEGAKRLLRRRDGGWLLWKGPECGYNEFWQDDLDAVAAKPYVIGMTHERARARGLSWVSSIILSYQPPHIGFRRSEQRLLICAMHGGTDQELSDELMISIATVKKTWRSIYDRVAERFPELIPTIEAYADGASGRGREKKQRLIAYLREHPEELRPVSRKTLRGGPAQSRPPQQGPVAS
jgi:hypothetical protein